MIFEVLRDGFSLLQSDQISYPKEILLDMAKYGHKFKVDGKAISVQKVIELMEATNKNLNADSNSEPKKTTKKKASTKK